MKGRGGFSKTNNTQTKMCPWGPTMVNGLLEGMTRRREEWERRIFEIKGKVNHSFKCVEDTPVLLNMYQG